MNQTQFEQAIRPLIDADWVSATVSFLDGRMETDGSHDYGHLLRVLRNAAKIREGEEAGGRPVDWEAVCAAGILHDLVNLPKDHPERHLASTKSAEEATSFFEEEGFFSSERRELIAEAIRCHSFSSGLRADSLEAQIVCDADRLESLGAIGVARVFQVAGMLGRGIVDMVDPFCEEREPDDSVYSVDHFFAKVLKLKDRFYTSTGLAIAEQRHGFILDYLEQLRDELSLDGM